MNVPFATERMGERRRRVSSSLGLALAVAPVSAARAGAPVIVAIEAEELAPSAGLEPLSDPEARGGRAIVLPEGVRLEGRLEVPRGGVHAIWIRACFGGARGIRASLAREGEPWGEPIEIARHGQRVIPGDRWLLFAGPWSGENDLALEPGRYRIRIASVSGRFLGRPGAKVRRAPLRLDAVFLSTFLHVLRPAAWRYNEALVAQAEATEAAEAASRAAAYAGDEGRGNDRIGKAARMFEDLLDLRAGISAAFREHRAACMAVDPEVRARVATDLGRDLEAVGGRSARLKDACDALRAEVEDALARAKPAWTRGMPRVPTAFLLSIDDVERPLPFPEDSPKWNVLAALPVDAIAPLAIGRYPGAVERAEGEYDFSAVEAAIRSAARHGYRTLQLLDPYPPRWVVERYGRRVRPERAGWGWINIWCPEAVAWARAYLKTFAGRFRRDRRIAAYALWNEPVAAWGRGADVEAAFRGWLRERYGSIEELDARWGASYRAFEEIAIPPRPGGVPRVRPAIGHLFDYLTFRAESFAGFFRLAIDALREGDPAKPVISRFAPSFFSRPADGLDFYHLARAGWDRLSMHDDLWPRALTCGNYIASMARYGRGALGNDECHWVVWESRTTRDERVLRACARRELWREVAWGKDLVNIERGLQAAWNDWNDSIAEPEHENETLRIAAGSLAVVRRAAARALAWCAGPRILDDGIAILEPWAALALSPPRGDPRGEAPSRGIGDDLSLSLLRHHLAHRVVPDRAIEDGAEELNDCRVLLLPYALHVPRVVERRLLEFVETGGILIAIGPPGLYDPYGRPSGALLEALLGEVAFDRASGPAARWRWAVRSGALAGGVEVLRRDGRGPVVLRARHGRGLALVTLAPAVRAGSLASEIESLLRRAVPIPRAACDAPTVTLTLRRGVADGLVLFAIQHDPRAPARTEVRLAGRWERIAEVSGPRPVAVSGRIERSGAGWITRFPLRLGPGGGAAWWVGRAGGDRGEGPRAGDRDGKEGP